LKAKRNWQSALAVAFAYMLTPPAGAQSIEEYSPNDSYAAFRPFNGWAGYREIRTGPDSWYVAFHGARTHTIDLVRLGWRTRAAQLCATIKAPSFVETTYVGEPVYLGEALASEQRAKPMNAAGYVFMPFIIPAAPSAPMPMHTPDKSAPIRCIVDTNGLHSRTRPISVSATIDEARRADLLRR